MQYSPPKQPVELKKDDLSNIIQLNIENSNISKEHYGEIQAQLEADIEKFKNGEEDWLISSKKTQKRCELMLKYVGLSSLKYCELLNVTLFRQTVHWNSIKAILSKVDHVNYSLNESQFNMLLTLQGHLIKNFTNLYLRKDFAFKDSINSSNIEFNNPYYRERIRDNNRSKDTIGIWYDTEVCLAKFCINLLELFFPNLNGIWADSHHSTHVAVLELTKYALEYGFFRSSDISKLINVLVKVCGALRKQQEGWNEKFEKEEEEYREEARVEILNMESINTIREAHCQAQKEGSTQKPLINIMRCPPRQTSQFKFNDHKSHDHIMCEKKESRSPKRNTVVNLNPAPSRYSETRKVAVNFGLVEGLVSRARSKKPNAPNNKESPNEQEKIFSKEENDKQFDPKVVIRNKMNDLRESIVLKHPNISKQTTPKLTRDSILQNSSKRKESLNDRFNISQNLINRHTIQMNRNSEVGEIVGNPQSKNGKKLGDADQKKNLLLEKIRLVSISLTECKEHIACIILQILTLHYDENFVNIYPNFLNKRAFEEDDELKMKDESLFTKYNQLMLNKVEQIFPFYQEKTSNIVLDIVMNYQLDPTLIAGEKFSKFIGNKKMTKANQMIEKTFMYVCSNEADCFIKSLKTITNNDLIFTDFSYEENMDFRQLAIEFRDKLLLIIDHIGNNGFDKYGNSTRTSDGNGTELQNKGNTGCRHSKLFSKPQSNEGSKQGIILKINNFIKSPFGHHLNFNGISHMQPQLDNCSSIFEMLRNVSNELMDSMKKNRNFKVDLTRQGIPYTILAVLDYLNELMVPTFNECSTEYYLYKKSSYHLSIEEAMESFYDTLLMICSDNSAAKAQIFKQDGSYHQINLLKRFDIQTMIFLVKITKEINIGGYFSQSLFDMISDIYQDAMKLVIKSISQEKYSNMNDKIDDCLSGEIDLIDPMESNDKIKKKKGKNGYDNLGLTISPKITDALSYFKDNYDKSQNKFGLEKIEVIQNNSNTEEEKSEDIMKEKKSNFEDELDDIKNQNRNRKRSYLNSQQSKNQPQNITDSKETRSTMPENPYLQLQKQTSEDDKMITSRRYSESEEPWVPPMIKSSYRIVERSVDDSFEDKSLNDFQKYHKNDSSYSDNSPENLSKSKSSKIDKKYSSDSSSDSSEQDCGSTRRKLRSKPKVNRRQDREKTTTQAGMCQIGFVNKTRKSNQQARLHKKFHTIKLGISLYEQNQIIMSIFIFQFLMNRFWDKLFEKDFMNEKETIRNMLKIQEIIFSPQASDQIPQVITILDDYDLYKSYKNIIDINLFEKGHENELVHFLLKDQLNYYQKKQVLLNVCTSTIHTMCKVASNVYSKNVIETIQPACKTIRTYMLNYNFKMPIKYGPGDMNSLLLNLQTIFYIVPDANWLIDRHCNFEKIKLYNYNDVQYMLQTQLGKIQQIHLEEVSSHDEVHDYIFMGLLPMIYKYVLSQINIVNYKNKDSVSESLKNMQELIDSFIEYNEIQIAITRTPEYIKCADMFTWSKIYDDINESTSELKKIDTQKNKHQLADKLKFVCDCINENICVYYLGWDEYEDVIDSLNEISHLQYINRYTTLRFKQKTNNPKIKDKLNVLNAFIKNYSETKQNFLNNENFGLTGYFKKNRDTLNSIFETCVNRMFDVPFSRRNFTENSLITNNPLLKNFWLTNSTFYFIQILELLFSSGKCARSLFYKFLILETQPLDNLYQSKFPNILTKTFSGNDSELPVLELNTEEIKISQKCSQNYQFISFICKLDSDLMNFLSTEPTQNAIWWNICELYALTNRFLKSQCEGNCQEFKEFVGEFKPFDQQDDSFNSEESSIVAFKANQLIYLFKSSLICENKEPYVKPTDQDRRMIPMLTPLIICLNEMCSGPCLQNINIIINTQQHLYFYSVFTRLIDKLDHAFYELKFVISEFLLSFCESKDQEVLKKLAKNLPAAVLEELLLRLVQKIYIRELIKDGELEKKKNDLIKDQLIRENEKFIRNANGFQQQDYSKPQGNEIYHRQSSIVESGDSSQQKRIKRIAKRHESMYITENQPYPNRASEQIIESSRNIIRKRRSILNNTLNNGSGRNTITNPADTYRNRFGPRLSVPPNGLQSSTNRFSKRNNNPHNNTFIMYMKNKSKSQEMNDNVSGFSRKTKSIKEFFCRFCNKKAVVFELKTQHQLEKSQSCYIDPNIIPQKLEEYFHIKDWKILKQFYMEKPNFSDGILFMTIFNILILWQELGCASRIHKNRLKEIRNSAQQYFKKEKTYTPGSFFSNEKNEIDIKTKKRVGLLAIFYFLSNIIDSIEVNTTSSTSVKTYFPIRPQCFMITTDIKMRYRKKCDITDSNKKMTDLMQAFRIFSQTMDIELELYRTKRGWYIWTSQQAFWIYLRIMWTIGLFINFFQAFDVVIDPSDGSVLMNTSIDPIIAFLTYLLIAISVISLLQWCYFRYKQNVLQKKEEYKIKYPFRNTGKFVWNFTIMVYHGFLREDIVQSVQIHVVFGILGRFVHYCFSCVHLFQLYNISTTARNLVHAVTKHIDQLCQTFLLMFFIQWMYAIWVMTEFKNVAWEDPRMDCSRLYNCFIYVLNLGLRNSGGIGDSFMVTEPNYPQFYHRFIYEVSFYILINLIFLNQIFGIILDTFTQLRTESENRSYDLSEVCFVCGLGRSEFTRVGKNFDCHIENEHNPWKYVFYIYYLEEKGYDELSGLQTSCYDNYLKLKTQWQPIGQTMYLKEHDKDCEFRMLNDKIEGLKEEVFQSNLNMEQKIDSCNLKIEDVSIGIAEIQQMLKYQLLSKSQVQQAEDIHPKSPTSQTLTSTSMINNGIFPHSNFRNNVSINHLEKIKQPMEKIIEKKESHSETTEADGMIQKRMKLFITPILTDNPDCTSHKSNNESPVLKKKNSEGFYSRLDINDVVSEATEEKHSDDIKEDNLRDAHISVSQFNKHNKPKFDSGSNSLSVHSDKENKDLDEDIN